MGSNKSRVKLTAHKQNLRCLRQDAREKECSKKVRKLFFPLPLDFDFTHEKNLTQTPYRGKQVEVMKLESSKFQVFLEKPFHFSQAK